MKSFRSELVSARTAKGIKAVDAAAMFGLSLSEYGDLESEEDEWLTAVNAYALRGPIAFFKIEWEICHVWKARLSLPPNKDLNAFIVERREQLGLSREEMADRAGFNVAFSEVVQGHPGGLALWPLQVTIFLAEVLGFDERSVVARLVGIGR
jgi:hypothetical protein